MKYCQSGIANPENCDAGFYCSGGSNVPNPCQSGMDCTTEFGEFPLDPDSFSLETCWDNPDFIGTVGGGICIPGYYCPEGSARPQPRL